MCPLVEELVEEYAAKYAEEYVAEREKIAAIRIYYQEMHLSVEQIAEKTGLSIEEVKNYISEHVLKENV